MKKLALRPRVLRLCSLLVMCVLALTWASAFGQRPSADVPAVMLSDFHFDPLHDPAKVPLLDKAAVTAWQSILDGPASADQQTRSAAVQETCSGKAGSDTPYALLKSSLQAARAAAPAAAFVTVSGDLLVHDLDCRYRAAMGMPPGVTDDQSASASFAEKTTVFAMAQIEAAFPRIPVYLALGNNDSQCNHNRLDVNDPYLTTSSAQVVKGLLGVNAREKAAALRTYQSAGYYAVTMPAPMVNTRLIVLNDIYMMPKFSNCHANSADHAGEREQMAWLKQQLEDARASHQRVWMLGHLPPSVNPDATLSQAGDFCTTGKTTRFQATEDLANEIMNNADSIKLGIFGHTHMDELHLLHGRNAGVPIKVIASITPVSGTLPSFTVGTVDPVEATLKDYAVYKASNVTGIDTTWQHEYSFNAAYGEAGFSNASLTDLIRRLRDDRAGTGAESLAYKQHFLKGSGGKKLSSSWPAYVCSLDNPTAAGFKSCVCAP